MCGITGWVGYALVLATWLGIYRPRCECPDMPADDAALDLVLALHTTPG